MQKAHGFNIDIWNVYVIFTTKMVGYYCRAILELKSTNPFPKTTESTLRPIVKYTKDNTRIAIIGGGNIGTQFACVCASKGYRVNVFTSKPEKFENVLEIVDEYEAVTVSKIALATSDIGEAVRDCQIVFVTHPAFLLKNTAEKLLPHVTRDMNFCVLPGTGGAELAFKDCIRAGATLFGLQRVPSVARLEEYGKKVRCEGIRPELFLASIPNSKAPDLAEFISSLWNRPCNVLPNYLSVTLTPSNPILHPARLRTLFCDYEAGKTYDHNPLFYGDWNDESSELLIACDQELQDMLGIMDKLDLTNVRSLKLHYESDTVEAMTEKIRSIKSLNHLSSPMKETADGWVPDFESRYFTADFPYGLAIIEEIAGILGYNAKNIFETMDWYRKVTGNTKRLDIRDYGIRTVDDIYAVYGN